MKKIILFFLLLLILGLVVFWALHNNKPNVYRLTGKAMDTNFEIMVYSENAKSQALSSQKIIKDLSLEFNWFDPTSPISQINALAGKSPVKINPSVLEVLVAGKKAFKETRGTFNLAIGPVVNLWKTAAQVNTLPPKNIIKKSLALCHDQGLIIDRRKQTAFLKKKGMSLNLGGIGKGFAVAKVIKQLKAQKVKAALVNMGSSIAVLGQKPDQKPWRIGVKHPRQPEQLLGIILLKSGETLSTSGDYERVHLINGKRLSHIIDPKSGYPAAGCQSVTVVTPDALLAEIYSTAIFVMGPWEGLRFARSKNVEVLIVKADGNLITSPGLKFEREKEI